MQTYHVKLESPVSSSYRCKRAADSLDIDVVKKSIHELSIQADLKSPYDIGLIVGASGSGKTTLAKKIFGDSCLSMILDETKPIIEQLPTDYDYETCANILSGIGLTSVPCWIRPVNTLSNGQKARAEAALLMTRDELTVIDEWTSVVDRTVAKVMSHCIQKHARKNKKQVVILSCHYDVIDWLNPDWIIDCNTQKFIDRRSLWQSFQRPEKLDFQIKRVGRDTWKYFSKYHYLSAKLPGGHIETYGLFHGENQIGFQCFANYTPYSDKSKKEIMHFNRTVIHPDYVGIGLGGFFIDETAKIMHQKNYRVMGKFSSVPVYKTLMKSKNWRLKEIKRQVGRMQVGGNMMRQSGFRENIKTYSFEYLGNKS